MKSTMKLRSGILLAALGAAFACAVPVTSHSLAVAQEMTPTSQSASGKVSAVSASAFSLEVKSGTASSVIEFVTDASTKVQGKLEAGSVATVEYTTDTNGKNLAKSITVQSAS